MLVDCSTLAVVKKTRSSLRNDPTPVRTQHFFLSQINVELYLRSAVGWYSVPFDPALAH